MNGTSGGEPRQRWRIVFARDAGAPPLTQRELHDAWDRALVESGLPVVEGGRRGPISFGAALPIGIAAERELADVLLTARRPVWDVRQRLAARLPGGIRLVDLHDVWLGEPPLAGQVAAAVYRVTLAGDHDAAALADGVRRLLAAPALQRTRPKGGGSVTYDLRPLIVDVAVERGADADAGAGTPPVLRIVTRIHPELGSGRPEEVVAALRDAFEQPLEPAVTVREGVLLRGELEATSVPG